MSRDQLHSAVEQQERKVLDADAKLKRRWREMRHQGRRLMIPALGIAGTSVAALAVLWSKRGARSNADPVHSMLKAGLPLLSPVIGGGAASLLLTLAAASARGGSVRATSLQVSPSVDLARYAGHWYEIARLPTVFESSCARNVGTTYTLQSSGLQVQNQCATRGGALQKVRGIAHAPDPSVGAKLKVCFAPAWLRWLPWVWADYWILDVAPDYSSALVATPDRRHLWVLSRTPVLAESTFRALLSRAAAQGFDTARVKRTPQTTTQ